MLVERRQISENALGNSAIPVVEGIKDFIKDARKNTLKVALATSAHRDTVDLILKKINLSGSFDVIVSAEDVTKCKPDSEVYLKTANQLGVQSGECLVFEDAESGVQAAKKAGMKVVGLLTSQTKQELAGADDYLANLLEASVERFDSA